MKWKTLIAMFVAFGFLTLGGVGHALLIMLPNGTKTQAQVVGNKLMLQTGPGNLAPAKDGVYSTGDGKRVVVRGGLIVPGGVASKVVTFGQLSSKAQFNALADDTLLDIGGRKVRKADFVAEFNRHTAAGPAGATKRPAGLAAIQARLTSDENAATAASDAEVRKRMAEIRAKGGKR